MFVIGLTGGIGTGKSEVSRLLGALGAEVIEADKVGHEAYEPGTPGWREVVEAFGEGVLDADGRIDRKRLGGIVFGDEQARERLNAIVHPIVRRALWGNASKGWIARERGSSSSRSPYSLRRSSSSPDGRGCWTRYGSSRRPRTRQSRECGRGAGWTRRRSGRESVHRPRSGSESSTPTRSLTTAAVLKGYNAR